MKKIVMILSAFIYSSFLFVSAQASTLNEGYYYQAGSPCGIFVKQVNNQLTMQFLTAPGAICLQTSMDGQGDAPPYQVFTQFPQRSDAFYAILHGVGVAGGPQVNVAGIGNATTFYLGTASDNFSNYSDAQIAAHMGNIPSDDNWWSYVFSASTYVWRGSAPQ